MPAEYADERLDLTVAGTLGPYFRELHKDDVRKCVQMWYKCVHFGGGLGKKGEIG